MPFANSENKTGGISIEEAAALLSDFSLDAVLKLMARANAARKAFSGERLALCSIVNARCGNCGEDCAFCAQSSRSKASIKTWPLVPAEELFEAAKHAAEMGVERFGIVTSGRALNKDAELAVLCEAIGRITKELPIKPCASLGILKEPELRRLKDAGLTRYHHNLEAAPSFFSKICGTRDFKSQTDSVLAAKAVGLEVCSGGIFGLGETFEQRAELLDRVRGLGVDSVPINFLNPIPGTPLADAKRLLPLECVAIVAVARLMMPRTSIRVCGGRELNLRDYQSWLLGAGADSLMTGGYLVTGGRDAESDRAMILDAGFSL
jgi:biotin synthase